MKIFSAVSVATRMFMPSTHSIQIFFNFFPANCWQASNSELNPMVPDIRYTHFAVWCSNTKWWVQLMAYNGHYYTDPIEIPVCCALHQVHYVLFDSCPMLHVSCTLATYFKCMVNSQQTVLLPVLNCHMTYILEQKLFMTSTQKAILWETYCDSYTDFLMLQFTLWKCSGNYK